MDHKLLATSAGYVRDSFVMASLEQFSEYEHLEKILLNAICSDPVTYDEVSSPESEVSSRTEKYAKYQKATYKAKPHYIRD